MTAVFILPLFGIAAARKVYKPLTLEGLAYFVLLEYINEFQWLPRLSYEKLSDLDTFWARYRDVL